MMRTRIRRSRLRSWPTVECTITIAGITVLDAFGHENTLIEAPIYLPRQWRVAVNYYFTFRGEYYEGSDHVILPRRADAEHLVARYPKDSHAMIAVNPADPEKEQFIVDLLK